MFQQAGSCIDVITSKIELIIHCLQVTLKAPAIDT